MDKQTWNTIKKMIKKEGSSCIVMDEEAGGFVIVPMEKYDELLEQAEQDNKTEEVNQTIEQWKSQEERDEDPFLEEVPQEQLDEGIKVEDLPF